VSISTRTVYNADQGPLSWPGRIVFEGEDITRAPARRVLEFGIAHCPEGRRVFPYMTVRENLGSLAQSGFTRSAASSGLVISWPTSLPR
jgi:ABC-type branched-subunit amino acid transport system ATPase component